MMFNFLKFFKTKGLVEEIMDMNQYTLFLPLDEKFESEELSLSYIVRLMFSVF